MSSVAEGLTQGHMHISDIYIYISVYIYIYKKEVKVSYCGFLEWQMTTAQQFVAGLSIYTTSQYLLERPFDNEPKL